MKQELTITVDVPAGHKAYWDGHDVVFVDDDDDITELPKSWEEFSKTHPIQKGEAYINSCSSIVELHAIQYRGILDKNDLPDKESAEQHLALMQLHQLRDCYRQGWKPDWRDGKIKHVVVRGFEGGYAVGTNIYLSTFLSFQSKRIAELFLANFQDLIRAAGDLI